MLTSAFSSLQRILSWVPHFPDRPAPAQTLQIAPSDLLESMPNSAREFRINPLCKVITEEVDDWAAENIALSLPRAKKTTLIVDSPSAWDKGEEDDEVVDLKIGLLGSLCFPRADPLQLRVCCKLLTWLWLLHYHLVYINGEEGRNCVEENIRLIENEPGSTEIVNAGFFRALQNVLRQLERSPESGYIYDRFRIALRDYLQLLLEHSSERTNSSTSRSAKDIVAQQRQRGWHTPVFILIEYAYGLKSLSEEHQRHRRLRDARDAAAEAIIYALDIYACAGALGQNKIQGLRAHNFIKLLAQEQSLSILSALDRAKDICSDRLRSFSDLHDQLLRDSSSSGSQRRNSAVSAPSDVEIYVRALGDCVRGVIYWAYESEVFFGRDGAQATLVVDSSSHEGVDL